MLKVWFLFADFGLVRHGLGTENGYRLEAMAAPSGRQNNLKGVESMKFHWSPNMMTFIGSMLLALVVSVGFVALMRGEGGGAYAFIMTSMIGTGMLVAGLLPHDEDQLISREEERGRAGQLR